MNVTVTDSNGDTRNAQVDDDNILGASIDLAWQYLKVYGCESATVRTSNAQRRGTFVCVVTCLVNDDVDFDSFGEEED